MPNHEIPPATEPWAVAPLEPLDGEPEGNGTGPAAYEPAPTVIMDPTGTLDRQPGTWPLSAFDLDLPEPAPDQPLSAPPDPLAPLPLDTGPGPDRAAQPDNGGSSDGGAAVTPVPAFRLALKIDDADTGVSRIELTATGSAAWVNSLVETAMFSFMEEVKRA